MIFFVEAAEVLFILYTALRSVAYGIWNIKAKNIPGGIMIFILTALMAFLLILNLYKSV